MNKTSEEDHLLSDALCKAGQEAVERKCRLGQYAVVWRNGQPAFLGPSPPQSESGYTERTSRDRYATGVREDVRGHRSKGSTS